MPTEILNKTFFRLWDNFFVCGIIIICGIIEPLCVLTVAINQMAPQVHECVQTHQLHGERVGFTVCKLKNE